MTETKDERAAADGAFGGVAPMAKAPRIGDPAAAARRTAIRRNGSKPFAWLRDYIQRYDGWPTLAAGEAGQYEAALQATEYFARGWRRLAGKLRATVTRQREVIRQNSGTINRLSAECDALTLQLDTAKEVAGQALRAIGLLEREIGTQRGLVRDRDRELGLLAEAARRLANERQFLMDNWYGGRLHDHEVERLQLFEAEMEAQRSAGAVHAPRGLPDTWDGTDDDRPF